MEVNAKSKNFMTDAYLENSMRVRILIGGGANSLAGAAATGFAAQIEGATSLASAGSEDLAVRGASSMAGRGLEIR